MTEKIVWSDRVKQVHKQYPSTVNLDWEQVFKQDPTVLGRIISDIFKLEAQEPGRPGKRPTVDRQNAEQYLKKYEDDDYSILPFNEAFKVLKGRLSFRGLANKCGFSLNKTQRLLSGESKPSVFIMEKVAKTFRKSPSYFVEYRVSYIVNILSQRMLKIPESSVIQYQRVKGLIEEKK